MTSTLHQPGTRPRSPGDAETFLAISREVFAPLYPYYAERFLAESGITSGVCLDLGCGGGQLGLCVAAGSDWEGKVTEVCKEMATGTRMYKVLSQRRTEWQTRLSFGVATEVELSGCVFDAIKVTSISTSRIILREQRFLWFPGLGLGLEIGRDGVDMPLTSMAPL